MHQHASVRAYSDEPVPDEHVRAIVSAAQRAATSSNLQTWTAIAVTQADLRRELSELCGNQAHVAAAPLVIVWCADLHRLERVCEMRGYSQVSEYTENFMVAVVDTGIAAQNGALAAESLGLGTCYIGAIRNDPQAVIELLGMPHLTFPVAGMTIGWPAARSEPKPRLPTDAVLYWDRYQDDDVAPLLHEYDRTMIASGIYSGRQVPVPGREGELEDYGWLEHSARRVSQAHRLGLGDALRRQGFALK
jgi:FMN reductase (NADPH)